MKTHRIIVWGGFGDALVYTPSFRALKQKNPKSRLIVYCWKDKCQLFKGNPHIDLLVPLYFWGEPRLNPHYLFNKNKYHYVVLSKYPLEKTTRVSVKKTVGDLMRIKVKDLRNEIYLSPKEDQWAIDFLGKYPGTTVAIHITSESSKNNRWHLDSWEELVKRHPDITFVQIGIASEEKVEGAVDMRGQTTLRQAIALVKHTDSFVGVESFFGHSTNAFDKKGVVLFTDSSPDVWGHDNNINIYKRLSCAPCYEVLNAMQCPYNNECKDHTVDEVSEALMKQLTSTKAVAI